MDILKQLRATRAERASQMFPFERLSLEINWIFFPQMALNNLGDQYYTLENLLTGLSQALGY